MGADSHTHVLRMTAEAVVVKPAHLVAFLESGHEAPDLFDRSGKIAARRGVSRTRKAELHEVITWLAGYDEADIQRCITEKLTFEEFFRKATLHPKAGMIKGMICGYRVEDITNPVTRNVRCLDKLADELAKAKKMEKILREEQVK